MRPPRGQALALRVEMPILLASTKKIDKLGFQTSYSLKDIIMDQLNYYPAPSC
jgi:GDP-D-mannose dehydratase